MRRLGAFRFRLGGKLTRAWRWVRSHKGRCHFRLKSKSRSRLTGGLTRSASTGNGGDYCRIGDEIPNDHPPMPPKGQLAVYVGGKRDGGPPQRYLVPVVYFNHPLFGELLRESEAEFGFRHPGAITIPCPVSNFERVRNRIAWAFRCTTAA